MNHHLIWRTNLRAVTGFGGEKASGFECRPDRPSNAELVEPGDVERLHAEGVGLIDLRPPEAFAAGRLPGAINVPIDVVIGAPTRARGAVILYDDDGRLVDRRCRALREAVGEMEFFVLAGGFQAWTEAGHAIEEA